MGNKFLEENSDAVAAHGARYTLLLVHVGGAHWIVVKVDLNEKKLSYGTFVNSSI